MGEGVGLSRDESQECMGEGEGLKSSEVVTVLQRAQQFTETARADENSKQKPPLHVAHKCAYARLMGARVVRKCAYARRRVKLSDMHLAGATDGSKQEKSRE